MPTTTALPFLLEAGLAADFVHDGDRYAAGVSFPYYAAVLALIAEDGQTTTILTASPAGEEVTRVVVHGTGAVSMAIVYAAAETAVRILGAVR